MGRFGGPQPGASATKKERPNPMCNNPEIQRRIALARAKAKFLDGASLDHVLGEAWNAGYLEANRDGDVDSEFDRQVDEINRDLGGSL